jgi:polyferredoxin
MEQKKPFLKRKRISENERNEMKAIKNDAKTKRARLRWARILVQIVFFLAAPALFSQAFSGAKEVFQMLGTGDVLTWSVFTTKLFVLCGLTILFGRIFCGWMCAFGALGDWVFQISQFLQKKLHRKLPSIPERAVPILQKIKYLILALVLLLCFFGKSSIVTKNSPWTVFSMLTAGNFRVLTYGTGLVLLILLILAMAVCERFFCQFLCPMGAIFSLLPELPFFKLKREKENCPAACKACKKNCPVQIKLNENPLWEGECIRCGRCTKICPRKNIHIFKK